MSEHTCMCVCVCLGGRLASDVLLNAVTFHLSWMTCVLHFLPSQLWNYMHILLCLAFFLFLTLKILCAYAVMFTPNLPHGSHWT